MSAPSSDACGLRVAKRLLGEGFPVVRILRKQYAATLMDDGQCRRALPELRRLAEERAAEAGPADPQARGTALTIAFPGPPEASPRTSSGKSTGKRESDRRNNPFHLSNGLLKRLPRTGLLTVI
ncbi:MULTISPECIES: hypothetical protein [unclassified Streptomyces]|uniref:Uncharacterized protein n=1 Tax=Streptomyces sp. NBC_00060 TaxID=2975636 RepID=A0AAU2HC60_9ACTN